MKNKTNQRGSITLFVVLACMFFIMFLTGIFMLGTVKRQAQIEATKQTQNIYSQGNAEQTYDSYFGDGVVPIYTKAQLEKMCSGEQIAINEEGGKIYTFSANSIYLLKEDISFEYNGVWQMPSGFGETGRIEGNGKKITIRDTSKAEEIYYYYTSENDYKYALTKEGYSYLGLMLHYDGINNTGDGHSSSATTWKDLSGNGYDGTLYNFTNGIHWEANQMRLDGINDYIATSLPQSNLGNNITISAVCVAEDTSNYRGLWGKHFINSTAGTYGGMLMQFADGQIDAGMCLNSAKVSAEGYKFKKIVLTCIMESGKPSKLYIDGQLVAEGSSGSEFIPLDNLEIGRSFNSSDCYWFGTISNFMVYNKLLAEEEIVQNYEVNKTRFKLRNSSS